MSSEATGAPADGSTASATTDVPAGTGSQATPDNDWRAALDEGTRKTVDAKGWKTPTEAVAGAVKSHGDLHREFEGLKAKSLVMPGDDAKPEDWAAFHTKLGRPEKPEGYEFKLPEGLAEDFPYDGKSAVEFKNWAHDAGLSPKQAQAVHDHYVKHSAAQLAEAGAAQTKALEDAHNALVKTWGDPASETYRRNQELANRALRQNGGSDLIGELKGIGALDANGNVRTPQLAAMLAKVGEALYAEDTVYGGPSSGPNPFSAASENLTKQGEVIRKDPNHARALIRAAGHNPAEWGL